MLAFVPWFEFPALFLHLKSRNTAFGNVSLGAFLAFTFANKGHDINEVHSYSIFFTFQHANAVRQKCLDLLDLIAAGATKQRPPNFQVPERELPCRFNVQPGTWFARDNVFNFILFCRRLGKTTF